MVLLIDNYDSFVYNLSRYVQELGYDTRVVRNDRVVVEDIQKENPSHIIISPGPCTPDEAGSSLDVIRHFSGKTPILGICLGHQAIAQAFGADIVRALVPMHGKKTPINHDGKGLFKGRENPLWVGRYHSLVVKKETIPDSLQITSWSLEGEIMSLRHKNKAVFGLQFHPESVLTAEGKSMISSFLEGHCYE